MGKEVDRKTCPACESVYRLTFSLESTSGFPKFCPFCGSDAYDDEEIEGLEELEE